jgi:hypothetical protein
MHEIRIPGNLQNYPGIQKHQKSQDSYRSFSRFAEHVNSLEAGTDGSQVYDPYAVSF